MAAEYIERGEMRAVLEKASISPRFADEPPTADVAPVRHGRWVNKEYGFAQCSLCGQCHEVDFVSHGYCPNCGAKMDKETEE